jgi:lysophospholipase L1-like esterase
LKIISKIMANNSSLFMNAWRLVFVFLHIGFFLPMLTGELDAVAQMSSQSGNLVPISDRNGDGVVKLVAFGDSVTYGVGDGGNVGGITEEVPFTDGSLGYPSRIETLAGILTDNRGVPGELFTLAGIERFPDTLRASGADGVAILEGANDAIVRVSGSVYSRKLQKAVNIARELGVTPYLLTLPRPCCEHQGSGLFTELYSNLVRETAAINAVPLVDAAMTFEVVCEGRLECFLYNLPEGLHPNGRGYDAISEVLIAQLNGIDLFAPDGPEMLAGVLGVDPDALVFPVVSSASAN